MASPLEVVSLTPAQRRSLRLALWNAERKANPYARPVTDELVYCDTRTAKALVRLGLLTFATEYGEQRYKLTIEGVHQASQLPR